MGRERDKRPSEEEEDEKSWRKEKSNEGKILGSSRMAHTVHDDDDDDDTQHIK